ncbi:MAG: ISKra4 family transposase [Actinobacteria bacterium]|nr:ISKra4 family transposase [Actinomycetota bacterium]
MPEPGEPPQPHAFSRSRERFDAAVGWLAGEEAGALSHAELEQQLELDSRELFRSLLQDHLDLRADREERVEGIADCEGVGRPSAEAGHERSLLTVFGEVGVRRIAYRARGRCNLYPADRALNLPQEKHSHGLRRLAAIESARGSFEDACEAVRRSSTQPLGKRQLECLARRSACDFDAFYAARQPAPSEPTPAGRGDTDLKRDADALVLSCDGKGVVMRPDALRPATRKQAAKANGKLKTRLSKGEKRNHKRIAEVGAVYDATPAPRSASDVLPAGESERQQAKPGPEAKHKWLTASVSNDAAQVVCEVFDEAERRDPEHQRAWLALVDGNNHQIDRIEAEAKSRDAPVAIIVDFIHVLEYLWKAAWCFHREGDPAAEEWVRRHAQRILQGGAAKVAGAIRRQATKGGLDPPRRAGADTCAAYLTNKRAYLHYPTALANGWPIATGVIEGACRHLVKDRMDLTGARWGLEGAEAILKLRAIRANGDFDDYWAFHLAQEHRRVHQSRYAAGAPRPPVEQSL